MGLDMFLYVAQKLPGEWDHADIHAWKSCHEIVSTFIFPSAEKVYNKMMEGLVPEIIKYYQDEAKQKGSGSIPMTNLDINAILSGRGGNLQVRMIYDVYNFDSYAEFKAHFIEEAALCIKYSQRYVSNRSEIQQQLSTWDGELPVVEYITWRKSPAIHSYFINKIVQRPKYYFNHISKSTILELKERIEQVLADPKNQKLIERLFPISEEGAFYGSYEYDDNFFEDMNTTLEKINEMEQKVFGATNSDELVLYYGYSA